MSVSGNVIQTWNASGRNIVTIGRRDGTNVADVGVKTDDSSVAQMLGTYSVLFGYAENQDKINRIRTTESGSVLSANGTNFKLLAAVSGDAVKISGQTVNIEGQTVLTSISGNMIRICPCEEIGDPIVLAGQIIIPSSATQLSNIPVSSGVALWNISIGQVAIGGIGGNAPSYTSQSNYIGQLNGGIDKIFPVTNLNQLSAVAEISGARLNYLAITISG